MGALGFADQAAGSGPLWRTLWALRNPIVHGRGLSGVGYQKVPGPVESRLTLRGDQAERVVAAAQWAGHDAASWGLHETGYEPLPEPLQFVEQFSAAVFRTASYLVIALADDLKAPSFDYVAQPDEVQRLRKFSLISGLGAELLASGAPLHVDEQGQ